MQEWTTPDCRNTPSTTNLEEEVIVDALGNDGNASKPQQVKWPNPWMMMMMMMMMILFKLTLKPSGYFIHNTRFNTEISTLCTRSAFLYRHVSQNKHRFFPWSALTKWVLQPRYRVFTVWYNLSIYTPFRVILFFTVLKTQLTITNCHYVNTRNIT